MFCAECGNAIRPDLNYCSRCGVEVAGASPVKQSIAQSLTNVVGAIGVFGLLGFVAILWMLLRREFVWAGAVWITLFYLATLFGTCALILRHISQLAGIRSTRHPNASRPELRSPSTAQLHEMREPAASVTDHTTKTLDEVPAARR